MDDEPVSAPAASSESSEGVSSRPSYAPLDSPSSSTFLRTAETLDGLARQMDTLKDAGEENGDRRCTCGAMLEERDRMEDKLKLSGGLLDPWCGHQAIA